MFWSRMWTGSCKQQYTTPKDLTDFWTTEAMGVAVMPCLCAADKLGQIEREEARIIESLC